jgi:hypothetical protein
MPHGDNTIKNGAEVFTINSHLMYIEGRTAAATRESSMKSRIILTLIVAGIAAGGIVMLRHRAGVCVNNAAGSEQRGDPAAALAENINALLREVPGRAVPDINRSKIFTATAWKKAVEEYALWLSGPAQRVAGLAGFLGTAERSASRVHADNFMSSESRKKLSPGQFAALWNSAFFAAGVAPDSGHRPLADSCYSKKMSFVNISALTSFVYEVSLIDTSAGRRTTFSVYPESGTLVLASPGAHVLVCRSSYEPGPGMIWRSTPTIIPVTVPESSSLFSFTLETHVLREKGTQ